MQVVLFQPAQPFTMGMLIRLFACAQRVIVRMLLKRWKEQEKFPALVDELWITTPDKASTTGNCDEPEAVVRVTLR